MFGQHVCVSESVFEQFLNLLLPSNCIFCRRTGSTICANCDLQFRTKPRIANRTDSLGGTISGISACTYDEKSAELIHEFKAQAQTSLGKFMAAKIITANSQMNLFDLQNAILIPVPSSEASMNARGFNPAQVLAFELAKRISSSQKSFATTINALEINHRVADQASLDANERRKNLIGAMSVRANFKHQALLGRQVMLVDDIVTTGSTLIEARRALIQVGLPVAGFMTFAETRQKVPRQIDLRSTFHSQAKLPEDGGHHGS